MGPKRQKNKLMRVGFEPTPLLTSKLVVVPENGFLKLAP
jgi:hypothetical protein